MTVTTVPQRPKIFPVLACVTCGAKVENPKPDLNVPMVARDPNGGQRETQVWFTRCLACNANTVRAWSYLETHLRVRKALGSFSYAVITVENALAVFDLLGIDRATVETYFATDKAMMNTLNGLSTVGAAARWSAVFVPLLNPEASLAPGWSLGGRWAHIAPRQRAELRTALAGLLRDRVSHARRWATPGVDAPGCLLCGVGHVEGTTDEMREGKLWSGPYKVQPGVLGGKRTPEPVAGYLCRKCAYEFEQVGAMGPTAMEKSLMAHFGLTQQPQSDPEGIDGADIFAWVALPPGTPPNKKPWEHLGDLAELKKKLENVPGVVVEFKSTRRNRAR